MKFLILICSLFFCNPNFSQECKNPYTSLSKVLTYDDFGFFGSGNQKMLEKLIKERNVSTVVELGAFLGKSTRFIAQCLPEDGKVYAVDHWKGNIEHQNPNRTDVYYRLPTLYEQFLSNVIHSRLCDKIVPLKMTTLEAAVALSFQVDMIYVDASHDFNSVLADLEAWYPFVKNYGILCGDDWLWGKDKNFPVRRAAEQFAKNYSLKCFNYENFWWFEE